jgi:hypothetical protein
MRRFLQQHKTTREVFEEASTTVLDRTFVPPETKIQGAQRN